MEVLGQLVGLSGHISPVAAYCQSDDSVLLMDVWWETRPVWVPVTDLWAAMDTVDTTSNKKVLVIPIWTITFKNFCREVL